MPSESQNAFSLNEDWAYTGVMKIDKTRRNTRILFKISDPFISFRGVSNGKICVIHISVSDRLQRDCQSYFVMSIRWRYFINQERSGYLGLQTWQQFRSNSSFGTSNAGIEIQEEQWGQDLVWNLPVLERWSVYWSSPLDAKR